MQLVIDAIRRPLELVDLAPQDLDLTLRLLRRARLLGRVATDLQAAGRLDDLRPVASDQLRSALVYAEARVRTACWELDRLARALHDLPQVPLVVLKGSAYVLAGLPNARGRSFADVDLLVPEAHLAAVEARLRQQGWQSAELSSYDEYYYRAWAHEVPPLRHAERDVEVDLHHALLMRTARRRPPPALLFKAARPIAGSTMSMLAPVDMVLHAIVHLFEGGEMDDALRELVDVADLLDHFGQHEPGFWEQFWPRAMALGLVRPAYYGVRYAARWFGVAVPESVWADSRVGAPAIQVVHWMDRLVPAALFPGHPDVSGRLARVARGALFVRSHWLKMPTGLLVRHLTRKMVLRWRSGGPARAVEKNYSH